MIDLLQMQIQIKPSDNHNTGCSKLDPFHKEILEWEKRKISLEKIRLLLLLRGITANRTTILRWLAIHVKETNNEQQ